MLGGRVASDRPAAAESPPSRRRPDGAHGAVHNADLGHGLCERIGDDLLRLGSVRRVPLRGGVDHGAVAAQGLAGATGAITLLISHRFSTVRMADLILVLERGRITASGDHASLMRAGGPYAELDELQARAYR